MSKTLTNTHIFQTKPPIPNSKPIAETKPKNRKTEKPKKKAPEMRQRVEWLRLGYERKGAGE